MRRVKKMKTIKPKKCQRFPGAHNDGKGKSHMTETAGGVSTVDNVLFARLDFLLVCK